MTGRAIVTTRLSRLTMNRAIATIEKVQRVDVRRFTGDPFWWLTEYSLSSMGKKGRWRLTASEVTCYERMEEALHRGGVADARDDVDKHPVGEPLSDGFRVRPG